MPVVSCVSKTSPLLLERQEFDHANRRFGDGDRVCCVWCNNGGGILAISLRDRLHLVLGFSAGAVIGVAFFDLMPEALESGAAVWGSRNILLLCAAGFFLYTMLDRVVVLHTAAEGEHCHHPTRGWIGAGSLSAHSFLDGFAIGIAFQASRAIGTVVAIAVLVHDFSDGLNTVNVVVRNGGDRHMALRWLLMDAAAPVVGAGLSSVFGATRTCDCAHSGNVLGLLSLHRRERSASRKPSCPPKILHDTCYDLWRGHAAIRDPGVRLMTININPPLTSYRTLIGTESYGWRLRQIVEDTVSSCGVCRAQCSRSPFSAFVVEDGVLGTMRFWE